MKVFVAFVCFLFGFAAAQEITSSECNLSKGCFRSPSNCTSSNNCDFMVTYKLNKAANTVAFEVSAKQTQATKWVAVGLSNVQTMVGARGEMCIDGTSGAQLKGFLTDKYGPPKMFAVSGNPSIVNDGIKSVNGALVCRFTRSVLSGASYQVGLNKKFYFVVASGNAVSASDEPNYHGAAKTSSPIKYNVAFPIGERNLTTVAPATTKQVVSNTTTTAAATTLPSNTTTDAAPETTAGMPVNSTTAMPSAEPSTMHSNSSSVSPPSAEPETTPSDGHSTDKPTDSGSGMIAPTTFVTIASLIFARMSS